ncbi:MAG: hypothetical protein ACTHM1_12420 [Solirubrobacteraceae bacterium]
MRKIQIWMTFIAVIAFGAFAGASASATQWLFKNEPIGTPHASNHIETLELIKEGGSLGSGSVKCSRVLVGTVGPGAKDEVTEVTSLDGTEKNLIKCERVTGFCFSPVMHALKLPWKTELLLDNGVTWDMIIGGEWEYSCVIGSVACKGEEETKFLKNISTGAEFGFEGEASGVGSCSDGGKATITGKGISLGVTVS